MRPPRLLVLVSAAVSLALALRIWVFETIYIASGSMAPTLTVGGRYISDKITLRLRPARRGDIVLFRTPNGKDISVGKRVIGLPGETVEMRDKKVWIDGRELPEPYAVHSRAEERLIGDTLAPLRVPPAELFVLGDNRDESEDSTVWKDSAGNPIRFIRSDRLEGLLRGAP